MDGVLAHAMLHVLVHVLVHVYAVTGPDIKFFKGCDWFIILRLITRAVIGSQFCG